MRVLRAAIGLALVASLLVAPVQARPQQPRLALTNSLGLAQRDHIVEQLSDFPYDPANPRLIVNPTADVWSVNDRWSIGGIGYLEAGGQITTAAALIAGYNPVYKTLRGYSAWWSGLSRSTGTEVTSPVLLDVNLVFNPGQSFSLTPVWVPGTKGKDRVAAHWRYSLCAQIVYTPDDPTLVLIEGSQAGTEGPGLGVPTTFSLVISNPSSNTVSDIAASLSAVSASGLGTDVAPGCPGSHVLTQSSYPFRWEEGL